MRKKGNTPSPDAAAAAADDAARADDAVAAEAADAVADDAAADAEDGEQTPAQQLEAAQQEAATHKENYLRLAAELENIRRRSERRISEAHQYALTDFALAVGEVRDCLQAALAAAAAENDKMREGVELTLRKLVSAMDARHILPIFPDIGAAFDPTLHMAIGRAAPTPQAPADTVAVVVQAGYMLNGRVIRAANVMVAADDAAEDSSSAAAADEAADADATH